MDRWVGKVAVVTGASSGIGSAIVVDLLKAGIVVVGLARRVERVEELRSKVPANVAVNLHARRCDISKEADILDTFAWVEKELDGVHILVNNAGISEQMFLVDKNNTEKLRRVIDTNVIGLVQCTREAFQSMKARNVAGHVVLINSIAGHKVPILPPQYGSMNIYSPTKFAVTAITEVLRQEFNNLQTKIKITSVSPGLVSTEIVRKEFLEKATAVLQPEDISAGVLYAIGTPAHVQVHELTIKPVGEPF